MSIELITSNHLPALKEAFNTVNSEINIISPFISLRMSKILCIILNEKANISCTVITRFYHDDFIHGASDISALKVLVENNVKVFLLKDLHTKAYLLDDNVGMLGSANFTSGGFILNHELSIMFKDEDEIVADMRNYFDTVLGLIQKTGDYMLTLQQVSDEMVAIRKKSKEYAKNYKKVNVSKSEKRIGAEINIDMQEPTYFYDSIQKLLYPPSKETDTKYFLKPVGVTGKPFEVGRYILDDRLYFSKRYPRAVNRGSILICYGVGSQKLLGYYESTSDEAIDDHTPSDERWPHYINAKCFSQDYSKVWWNFELKLGELRDLFILLNPDKAITYKGSQSLGSLNWGSDKVRISNDFAQFLIEKIDNFEN